MEGVEWGYVPEGEIPLPLLEWGYGGGLEWLLYGRNNKGTMNWHALC